MNILCIDKVPFLHFYASFVLASYSTYKQTENFQPSLFHTIRTLYILYLQLASRKKALDKSFSRAVATFYNN